MKKEGRDKIDESAGTFRKPKAAEAKQIQELVNFYAKKDEMLPRALNDIYEFIRDFWIYEEDGEIVGCCALNIDWADLAEVRSLAVSETHLDHGIGSRLVEYCIEDAKELGITKVFALTYKPEFFKRLGFHGISKDKLPRKIWSDCLKCPKFPDCDEVAVMKELE